MCICNPLLTILKYWTTLSSKSLFLHCFILKLFLCLCPSRLLHELVELRAELSKLLRSDIEDHKSRIREAQSATLRNPAVATADVESDLSDWLSDVADADTIQKVRS